MISGAVAFALLSLFFSGINDVVFKRYSRKLRSRGMLICGIGIVWTLLQWLEIQIFHGAVEFDRVTWIYGGLAGVCVALANIGLLEALRHMDVSLGSTIYRLNTIGVVVLSLVFLHESLSLLKFSGIILGIAAVLVLNRMDHGDGQSRWLNIGLFVMVGAALLRAAYGVVSKAGLTAGASADTMILISSVCWIISGIGYAVFVEHRYAVTRQKIAYSLVSGCLVFIIVKTLITALALGEASVVVPIANMSFLVALIVAVLFKMERLNPRKILAMGMAAGAIILLTRV